MGVVARSPHPLRGRHVHLGVAQLRQSAEGAAVRREWAAAFRKMDALEPEILLPGHGLPIVGAARVHQALSEGAELLEILVEETLALMNEGARLDDIVHTVRAPEHLRAALPPTDLRRARVRRPQHLAPLRRLVRRRPVSPQAGPAGGARGRARGPRRGRRPSRRPGARGRGGRRPAARGPSRGAGGAGRARRQGCACGPRGGVRRACREEASTMSKGIYSWAEHESREKAVSEAKDNR